MKKMKRPKPNYKPKRMKEALNESERLSRRVVALLHHPDEDKAREWASKNAKSGSAEWHGKMAAFYAGHRVGVDRGLKEALNLLEMKLLDGTYANQIRKEAAIRIREILIGEDLKTRRRRKKIVGDALQRDDDSAWGG